MWGSLESSMKNDSFKGHKIYVCNDVKGSIGVILCVRVNVSVRMSKLGYCSSVRQRIW